MKPLRITAYAVTDARGRIGDGAGTMDQLRVYRTLSDAKLKLRRVYTGCRIVKVNVLITERKR